MIKKLIVLIMLLTLFFLSGCWDINEIERTQFPAYITIDKSKEASDSYRYSIQFPVIQAQASKKINTLTVNAKSLQEAINKLQLRTMGRISLGMLKTVIFSQEVAEEGMISHIDVLWRNPTVAGTVVFAITSGQASKLQDIKIPTTDNLGNYLESLFYTASGNSLVVQQSLNDFFINLKSQGIEPSIPLIKYGTTDVEVVGTVLFKGDKMIGTIQRPETRALLLLKEKFVKGQISLKVDDYMVTYYVQQVDNKIKPSYQKGQFTFDINLKLKVDIMENNSGKRLINNKAALKNMEQHLAVALKKEIYHLFKDLQQYKSDVLGVGKIVKAKNPELFNPKSWEDDFRRAKLNINTKVIVIRFGIST